MKQYWLKTGHGTFAYLDHQGHLAHGVMGEDACESLQTSLRQVVDAEVDFDIIIDNGALAGARAIILPDGVIGFKRSGLYLCAEMTNGLMDFNRLEFGPWEAFEIVERSKLVKQTAYEAIPLGEGSRAHELLVVLEAEEEYLPPPLSKQNDEIDWFARSAIHFFPQASGANTVASNRVFCCGDMFVSARYGAQGTIFDKTGFYHNAAFLSLRKDTTDLIRAQDGRIFARFEKIKSGYFVEGCYSTPFDGNSFNYYHWLLEGMLTWFALKTKNVDVPPMLFAAQSKLSSWQKEFFDIVELTDYKIIDAEAVDAVAVERLVWIERRNLTDFHSSLLASFSDFILSRLSNARTTCRPELIYVRRAEGTARSVANSAEFDLFLKEQGFEILALETMGVRDQVIAFRSAKLIVGPHGAGLANLVFANAGTNVIELLPDGELRNFFWILSAKKKLMYRFMVCVSPNGYSGPLEVDIVRFQTILSEAMGDTVGLTLV